MPADNGQWISWMWRVAVLVVFGTQFFLLGLRTSAGARIIPRMLLRAHIIRPRQATGLLNSVKRPGGGAVPELAQEIDQTVPRDCQLELVWNGPQLPLEGGELGYRIYPRRFSQRSGVAGDPSATPCRIDWRSESDVTLSTPDSVWTYRATGASAQ